MPAINIGTVSETTSGNAATLLGCVISVTIVVSVVLVWAVCACCTGGERKGKEEQNTLKKGAEEQIETPKKATWTPSPPEPTATPSPRLARSLSPPPSLLAPPSLDIETKKNVVPPILMQPSGHKTTIDQPQAPHYFEIEGLSRVKKGQGGTAPTQQPQQEKVPGRTPAYETLALVDSKFEASKVAKKDNAAATMDAKTAMPPMSTDKSAIPDRGPAPRYFSIGAQGPVIAPAGRKNRAPTICAVKADAVAPTPKPAKVPGRTPAYQTFALVDSKFDASNVVVKKGRRASRTVLA